VVDQEFTNALPWLLGNGLMDKKRYELKRVHWDVLAMGLHSSVEHKGI
jgi:hypothetical protein